MMGFSPSRQMHKTNVYTNDGVLALTPDAQNVYTNDGVLTLTPDAKTNKQYIHYVRQS